MTRVLDARREALRISPNPRNSPKFARRSMDGYEPVKRSVGGAISVTRSRIKMPLNDLMSALGQ